MLFTAYPIGADLQNYVETQIFQGLTLNIDYDGAIEGAVAELEERTGRKFIADATASTRVFDLPQNRNAVINFNENLWGLPTGVSVFGVAKDASTDYGLLDPAANERSKPFWGIRFAVNAVFASRATGIAQLFGAVAITGKWGSGVTLPADLWRALLGRGAQNLYGELVFEKAATFNSVSEGGAQQSWGSKPLDHFRAEWDQRFEKVVQRYQRVTVGLG